MRNAIAAAAATLLLSSGAAFAAGDAEAGATVFKRCAACHSVGENATNRVGPVLNGVVGRQPGTYEGYSYSPAMTKFGTEHPAWTPELLTQFVQAPRDVVPGTKMTFPGLKTPADAENVVAYLISLSPDYVPAEQGAAPAAPAEPAPAAK
jgi:cytochrome c